MMAKSRDESSDERAPLLATGEPSYTMPSEPTSEVAAKSSWLHLSRKRSIAIAVLAIFVSSIVISVVFPIMVLRDKKVRMTIPSNHKTLHNHWFRSQLTLTSSKEDHGPPGPIVSLTYTRYEGIRHSNGVNAFLGMRYAAPPLGDLRWRAPVEPKRTADIEKADQFGPICLRAGGSALHPGQDEDCLFVNLWAPANATEKSKLPVWVFIGGGGECPDLIPINLYSEISSC